MKVFVQASKAQTKRTKAITTEALFYMLRTAVGGPGGHALCSWQTAPIAWIPASSLLTHAIRFRFSGQLGRLADWPLVSFSCCALRALLLASTVWPLALSFLPCAEAPEMPLHCCCRATLCEDAPQCCACAAVAGQPSEWMHLSISPQPGWCKA